MSESDENILHSGEIELYVQSLEPSKFEDIGSPGWFESHHRLQKLGQQSTMEAKEMRNETVKDFMISYGKMPILVHEAICIQVWREKIFNKIIKLKHEPQNTFIAYIILFHEITAIGLLENLLYHRESMQEIEGPIIDLIDYCASQIVALLSEDYTSLQESSNLSNMEEIKSQSKTISFNIGLSCLCIIRYLVEFHDELPISAISRLFRTHDMPLLMTNLIQMAPWKRINPKTNTSQIFEDRIWKNVDKTSGIPKYEGQCWIALRFLLLDLNRKFQYEINDFRKQHFLKVQKYLNELVIDQIPLLIDLSRFLSQLSMSNVPLTNKTPLIMETIPEIKAKILQECLKKLKKLARKHTEMIFNSNKDVMMEVAKRLGETYDLDHLEKLFPEGPVCSNCGDAAAKRCSKCKSEWYCGRECQVKRWPHHKKICDMLSEKGEGDN